MAFEFDKITFNLKDLILIIGVVSIYYDFKAEQKESYNELKIEMRQIVAESKIQELKINTRIDEIKNLQFKKDTQKQASNIFTKPDLITSCTDKNIRLKKKKLFKYSLI
jgi:hypothetical protein